MQLVPSTGSVKVRDCQRAETWAQGRRGEGLGAARKGGPHMHRGKPRALRTTEAPRALRFLPQKAQIDEPAGGGVWLPPLPLLHAVPGGRAGLAPHIRSATAQTEPP